VRLKASDIAIPGDISSAAFFIVAASILQGSKLVIQNVGINSSRAYLLDKLKDLGVEVTFRTGGVEYFEPRAHIEINNVGIKRSTNQRPMISDNEIALLIDEIPILAVLGTQCEGGLEVRDAKELRIKETDRITAICENLRRMNAAVEEFEDGFRVWQSSLKGARVDSFGDHRIAMAFAVAGLVAEGETEVIGSEAASISFPGFYELLESVVVR
jgi:3-phosphoshikimate 1-carboxyvinyltransferase